MKGWMCKNTFLDRYEKDFYVGGVSIVKYRGTNIKYSSWCLLININYNDYSFFFLIFKMYNRFDTEISMYL